eukprot:7861014-Prorocentrum_lima.AAC.1
MQEALQNVLALLESGTNTKEQERAWKLFAAFPKLLLSTDGARGGHGKNGARTKTLTKTLGARLRDWRGGLWASLWQSAQMTE